MCLGSCPAGLTLHRQGVNTDKKLRLLHQFQTDQPSPFSVSKDQIVSVVDDSDANWTKVYSFKDNKV